MLVLHVMHGTLRGSVRNTHKIKESRTLLRRGRTVLRCGRIRAYVLSAITRKCILLLCLTGSAAANGRAGRPAHSAACAASPSDDASICCTLPPRRRHLQQCTSCGPIASVIRHSRTTDSHQYLGTTCILSACTTIRGQPWGQFCCGGRKQRYHRGGCGACGGA